MNKNDYRKSNNEFFNEKTGYSNVVYTNGGTSALHAFFLAQNFKQGREVIFPVECYPTLPMIAIQCGLKPVFADIDENYNLSPKAMKSKITDNTCAIVVIHMAGIPAKIDQIAACLERRDDIVLVEDWCQAFGTLLKGGIKKHNRTQAAILSFSSSKLLSIDGGGLCLTDNKECADKMECIIHNGYDPAKRFIMCGYTYCMHSLQHQMLYEKIKKVSKIIEKHDKIFDEVYDKLIPEFEPICKKDDKILQHKLVTQVALDGFDFGKIQKDPIFKKFFYVGEYHYPVDVYNEAFMKEYYLHTGDLPEEQFPIFTEMKKSYFAFRVQSDIESYVMLMKEIIKKM